MTDEQRLDRLERIVKLMIKAGLRARKTAREQDEKINILISMHLKNEEQYARNFANHEERIRKNEEAFAALTARTEELTATTKEAFAAMTAAEARTEERLNSFMEAVERFIDEGSNGKP